MIINLKFLTLRRFFLSIVTLIILGGTGLHYHNQTDTMIDLSSLNGPRQNQPRHYCLGITQRPTDAFLKSNDLRNFNRIYLKENFTHRGQPYLQLRLQFKDSSGIWTYSNLLLSSKTYTGQFARISQAINIYGTPSVSNQAWQPKFSMMNLSGKRILRISGTNQVIPLVTLPMSECEAIIF